MRVRGIGAAIAASFVVALSPPARADAKTEARARALFEQGRAAQNAGNCSLAVEKFSAAREVYPTAGSLYNMADCEERLGHLLEARADWAKLLGELKPGDARGDDARAHIDALDKRIPTAKISLHADAPSGTRVTLDGAPIAPEKLGDERPMNPGKHLVVVLAPGRERRETQAQVVEGARGFAIHAELGAVIAPPVVVAAPTPAAPTPTRHAEVVRPADATPPPSADVPREEAGSHGLFADRSQLAWISGGVGAGGLAVSLLSGAVLLGKKGTIADHCDAAKRCDQDGLDAAGGVGAWSALGTGAFVLGAAGIAGFLVLPREGSHVGFAPVAGPSFAALGVRGKW